jgi:hypothetical protein
VLGAGVTEQEVKALAAFCIPTRPMIFGVDRLKKIKED